MQQEQFQAALDAVCDEVDLVCQPSAQRVERGDTVDGVTITKARCVQIRSETDCTPENMQQAFRTLVREMLADATTGSLVSCFVPANIWDDAVEMFTLRNAKTGVGIVVFFVSSGTVSLAAAWGTRGR